MRLKEGDVIFGVDDCQLSKYTVNKVTSDGVAELDSGCLIKAESDKYGGLELISNYGDWYFTDYIIGSEKLEAQYLKQEIKNEFRHLTRQKVELTDMLKIIEILKK